MPHPTRQQAALTAFAAELASYPVHTAEADALRAFAVERVRELASLPVADAGGKHCARCRRDIATELGRQAFMN